MKDKKRFVTREYCLSSPKVTGEYRLVFISDLHETVYGEGHKDLLAAVAEAKPDAVLIGGDSIIARHVHRGEELWLATLRPLMQALCAAYPVYAAEGNHESHLRGSSTYASYYVAYSDMMQEAGAVPLVNAKASFQEITLYGISPDDVYYRKFCYLAPPTELFRETFGEPDAQKFSLVLAHHPRFFPAARAWGADVMLAGHFHGGLIRFGNRGLISPEPVLFPRYSGGLYREGESTLIVSCGLGVHTVAVRYNNPGELVLLRLLPEVVTA